MKIALIGFPSSIGARSVGTEQAPAALRRAGLAQRLQARGHAVKDFGDLPEFAYVPDLDPAHRKAKNQAGVAQMAEALAPRVETLLREGFCPLLLGGDCTIALGSMAGATRVEPELGLAYLDRDAELNTPRTTPSGILDGMVIALLLGLGIPALARFDSRAPLLSPGRLALLGVERLDDSEVQLYEALPSYRVRAAALRRAGGQASAREALKRLEQGTARFLIHFDLDLLDGDEMPAVDGASPGGLSMIETQALLGELLASSSFAGMEITNFNPQLDPDGKSAEAIVELISRAFPMEGTSTTPEPSSA